MKRVCIEQIVGVRNRGKGNEKMKIKRRGRRGGVLGGEDRTSVTGGDSCQDGREERS